jgi:pilus assembly protein CpaF
MSALIRTALRMRPNRILIGEVRGEEAADMLQAMNTGHEGSLSTGHANSCRDMLSRLEMMVLSGMRLPLEVIRQQLVSAIDIMVHLTRLRDGRRVVTEITEMITFADGQYTLNPLYVWDGSVLRTTGEPMLRMDKLLQSEVKGREASADEHRLFHV